MSAPNAYELKPEEAGPKYTMPGRAKDVKKFQTPAPGTYEVDDDYDHTMESSPSYTFGQKNDIARPNIVPGKFWRVLYELIFQLYTN